MSKKIFIITSLSIGYWKEILSNNNNNNNRKSIVQFQDNYFPSKFDIDLFLSTSDNIKLYEFEISDEDEKAYFLRSMSKVEFKKLLMLR